MNITIIGIGKIGSMLTKRLSLDKINITLIDQNSERVEYARENLDAQVIEGDGLSYHVLEEAGMDNCDIFAALTSVDYINLLSCQLAKKMGAKYTIARVRNPDFFNSKYNISPQSFGIDSVVHPELETAKAIIRLVKQSGSTDIIEFEKGKLQFSGIRLEKNAKILHTPLKELSAIYGNPPMRVVAIKRNARTIIPGGNDLFLKGDQIFFICQKDFLNQTLEFFGKANAKIVDILISGGGMIGETVAMALENEMNVKIIESNEKKAEMLAHKLNNTLVIHGDGSDLDILHYEGLTEMDEFIAVTGDDETNIITSIVARHLEVPRTITLIKKDNYLPLTPALSMDAIVSKQQITVSAILKFIKRRNVEHFAELPGVDAEIIEYNVPEGSKICKKTLMEINFPKDAIVGAIINQNDNLVIPRGDTKIVPGDKVVIFALPQAVKSVERLFN